MYLCDTPGFEDTAGAEVDISNTLGLIEAIQKCKNVRPVVVLSFDGIGSRLEGIIDLAQLLDRLCMNVRDILDSITFIYTKWPEDVSVTKKLEIASQRDELDEKIKDIILNMIEKSKRDPNIIELSKP